MSTRFAHRTLLSSAAFAAVIAGLAVPATATTGIRNAFTAKYPNSTLLARTQTATGSACYACHQPPNTSIQGNCYRTALSARIAAGRTAAQAIADLDLVDSDGDGVPNGEEINMVRADLPGQIGYNPGLVGDLGTDPCGTNTTAPVTRQPETPPPPACVGDFNNDGGVDGSDIEAFFLAWEVGDSIADVNQDGGDIEYFFVRWQAGC